MRFGTKSLEEGHQKPAVLLETEHIQESINPVQPNDETAYINREVMGPCESIEDCDYEKPAILEELVIQEISIDAICGVY